MLPLTRDDLLQKSGVNQYVVDEVHPIRSLPGKLKGEILEVFKTLHISFHCLFVPGFIRFLFITSFICTEFYLCWVLSVPLLSEFYLYLVLSALGFIRFYLYWVFCIPDFISTGFYQDFICTWFYLYWVLSGFYLFW